MHEESLSSLSDAAQSGTAGIVSPGCGGRRDPGWGLGGDLKGIEPKKDRLSA